VIAKLRSKLKSQSKLKQDKMAKVNLELLNDEIVRKNYENEVMKNLKENNLQMDVDLDWENLSYGKVSDIKYLGVTLSTKNNWSKEINIRINKAQKMFYELTKFLTSKILSRKTKVRLFIIRPTLTYGCEAWTTTKSTEGNLRKFEHRV